MNPSLEIGLEELESRADKFLFEQKVKSIKDDFNQINLYPDLEGMAASVEHTIEPTRLSELLDVLEIDEHLQGIITDAEMTVSATPNPTVRVVTMDFSWGRADEQASVTVMSFLVGGKDVVRNYSFILCDPFDHETRVVDPEEFETKVFPDIEVIHAAFLGDDEKWQQLVAARS